MNFPRNLAGYELDVWRRPVLGDFYLVPGWGVQRCGEGDERHRNGENRFIVKPKTRQKALEPQAIHLTTAVNIPAADPKPVLVAEFFDADGNTSTNTFYDADLARDFYGRA